LAPSRARLPHPDQPLPACRLPLEKFVSERIALDQVENAFHKVHAGEVPLSVVVL
jgi:Zn-dependent alcohol dehydrogenase